MSRIEGYFQKESLLRHLPECGAVHLEKIPANAIRGEVTVRADVPASAFRSGIIELPYHLIGKKVAYTIIPLED